MDVRRIKTSKRRNDELYHYGTKGQKWGMRRYQNPDGSLTPAGRARYQKDLVKSMKTMNDGQIQEAVSSKVKASKHFKDYQKAVKLESNSEAVLDEYEYGSKKMGKSC